MRLSFPLALLLLLPWTALILAAVPIQLKALAWIEARTAPGRRNPLTALKKRSLIGHLSVFWLTGFLVVVALAGPYRPSGSTESQARSPILMLVDASLSMAAPDAAAINDPSGDPVARLEASRQLMASLIRELPGNRIGIISFAGEAVIHMPPTDDRHALLTVLQSLKTHNWEISSGTRFSRAFDAVAHLMLREEDAPQILLFSDGELSLRDDFGDGIAMLAHRGIPLHVIAMGSEKGITMEVYDHEDLRAGVESPRIAAEFTTSRDLSNLKKMSRPTGGMLLRGEDFGKIPRLLRRLEAPAGKGRHRISGEENLAHIFMLAALLLLILESWSISSRGAPASNENPWTGVSGLFLLLFLFLSGTACRPAAFRAHRLNERGLALEKHDQHRAARRFFESSAAWAFREEIPLSNLARSRAEEEDWAGAHEDFQRAIRIKPRMAEALYDDGWVLYEWGREELRPESCEFERVRELWNAAGMRFRQAEQNSRFSFSLRQAARINGIAVQRALEELQTLEENCEQKGAGGGGGDGGDNSSNGGSGNGGNSGGGEGNPPPAGEAPSGGGGLSPEEHATLKEELSRVRKEAETATDYSQSSKTRITEKSGEGGKGRKIWW